MEDGTITLVGATTENPSFELNAALLSRARVMVFKSLDEAAHRAICWAGRGRSREGAAARRGGARALVRMADGDGRAALTLAEEVWRAAKPGERSMRRGSARHRAAPRADLRQGAGRPLQPDLALHKCVRGSDPDAALYYLARMLDAGEDPLYLGRRLVRMAVEDIGLADPQALAVATRPRMRTTISARPRANWRSPRRPSISPPRRNRMPLYTAFKAAMRAARKTGSLLPPKTILNAPTKLMKQEGYGRGLRLRPRRAGRVFRPGLFPGDARPADFYEPVERGFEREIRKRLDWWAKLRAERGGGGEG